MTTCPHCHRDDVPPSHFYPSSGKPRCARQLVWTVERRNRLVGYLEAGLTDPQIARRMGCSAEAVHQACKRYRLPSRTASALNTRSVARLLGLGCSKSVTRWIANGWLRAHPGQPRGGSRQWVIRSVDLMAFLECPDHWHRWTPDRITDPFWRQWTLRLRGHVRYLTLGEAARIACVEAGTVAAWIDRGWLPDIRNGNHVVRESDLTALLERHDPWGRKAA